MALDAAYFSKTYPWSDIRTETVDGQTMVWIPKFYYRAHTPTTGTYAGKKCWEIADSAVDGFVVHPAFMKAGVEISGFYVGAYECSADASDFNKAASIVGRGPMVNIEFPTMQARCAARNTGGQTGWHLWNIYELAAIQMLCLVELGSPDVQTHIGSGNSSSSAAVEPGSSNAKWRGISELWGNVWHAVDGLKGSGTTIQILDRLGNGTYVNTGVSAPASSGYPKDMMDGSGAGYDFNDVFIPKNIDATASNGTYGDYYYEAISNFVCYHGGYWENGAGAGLFFLSLNNTTSLAYSANGPRVGGRLAKN